MPKLLRRFLKDCSGAVAIEYILIASFVSVMLVFGATSIGTKTSNAFNNVSSSLR